MSYSVAVVLYDEVSLAGLASAYEGLLTGQPGESPRAPFFEPHTVSQTKEPVTCKGGVQILPAHTFPDAFVYDVIFVPDGPGAAPAAGRPRFTGWLARAGRAARLNVAAGRGVWLLAAAGLLDHQPVAAIPELVERFPALEAASGGRIVAGAGVLTAVSEVGGRELFGRIAQLLLGDQGGPVTIGPPS